MIKTASNSISFWIRGNKPAGYFVSTALKMKHAQKLDPLKAHARLNMSLKILNFGS